jgi:hypothetical protein
MSRLTSPEAPEALFERAVVLVEGISDRRALEALAERRGRKLDAEGVSIVPIGGAQAIGRFLQKQPAKRGQSYEEQLWRFMWNRKIRYAPLLVGALDLSKAPRPLDAVLAHV